LLAALLAAECNIFGSYALLTRPRGRTALALHVEDNECAVSVLQSQQFTDSRTIGYFPLTRIGSGCRLVHDLRS
jgi:hypothetical protein